MRKARTLFQIKNDAHRVRWARAYAMTDGQPLLDLRNDEQLRQWDALSQQRQRLVQQMKARHY